MKLTIGMATFNDYAGVKYSIQALRLYQDLTDVELLVIDNFGCEKTKWFVQNHIGFSSYVLSKEVNSTAQPRNLVFEKATGDAVLCMDSHVFFEAGAIARLKQYYHDNQAVADLLQGPMLNDDCKTVHGSLWTPDWRSYMFGCWGYDPRGNDREAEPFDIPLMGLGVFSCRRNAWLGFNKKFRGFGGEEGYIHEKFRKAGRRCLCLPWLRWWHNTRIHGENTPYPNVLEDRFRNYIIGWTENEQDTKPIFNHFKAVFTEEKMFKLAKDALSDVAEIAKISPYINKEPELTPKVAEPEQERLIACDHPGFKVDATTHNHIVRGKKLLTASVMFKCQKCQQEFYPGKMNEYGELELTACQS